MKSAPADDPNTAQLAECEVFPKILKVLLRHAAVPAAQLAVELGFRYPDLERCLSALVQHGYLQWDGFTETPDRETRLSLQTGTNFFIGIDLGGTKLYGGIVNLQGQVLFDVEQQHQGKTGEACFTMLSEALDALLEHASRSSYKVRGIGIQVPGRVDLETGVVVHAAAVKWENFPLKERLAARYGLPVHVDNDLKQSALGEAWFGAGKFHRDVALVAIGTGLAVGLVAGEVLQRGAHLRHGEVGWMVPGREFLGRTYHGYGALEQEAAGAGVARRARLALQGVRSEAELASLTSQEVFEAARHGEAWALPVVTETVEYLAVLIANVMAFYDPDVIILSGGVSRSHDLLVEPIQRLIAGNLLIPPNIVISDLGYQAGVLGALVNLLELYPEVYSPAD